MREERYKYPNLTSSFFLFSFFFKVCVRSRLTQNYWIPYNTIQYNDGCWPTTPSASASAYNYKYKCTIINHYTTIIIYIYIHTATCAGGLSCSTPVLFHPQPQVCIDLFVVSSTLFLLVRPSSPMTIYHILLFQIYSSLCIFAICIAANSSTFLQFPH